MKYTDSHCHLDFKEFTPNTQQLVAQCANSGIHQIVIPATSPNNWQQILTLCEKSSTNACRLYPSLGIHPWFLNDLNDQHLDQLTLMVEQNHQHIIAIGETGLDGAIAKEFDNLKKQISFFEHQLVLAKQYQRPIIVHHRQSHNDIMPLLKQAKLSHGGVIHAFSGSYQQAKAYVDLGFTLGIGGTITYPRAQKTINALKRLPVSSLVLETDAPSMPLFGFQGKPNSPLAVVKIFNALKEILELDEISLAEQLELNINALFNLS